MKNIFIFLLIILLESCTDTTKKYEDHMAKENSAEGFLYKIVSIDDWNKSKLVNYVVKSEMDKEFIHLATKEQLQAIASKFWTSQEYIILELDIKKINGRLVQERNPGGTTLYYHLYEGNIPLDAVTGFSLVQQK